MRKQYEELYKGSGYRQFSPGEFRLPDFYKRVPLTPDDVVIDFGCGTGRATKAISKKCKVIGLDFVNALETDVEFHEQDLTKPIEYKGTIGFCCDVMEHIHPRKVKTVLRNIMHSVDKCYFQICTVPDTFGDGHLHLTVKPFSWWAQKLRGLGIIRYAREEINHSIFIVQRSITIKEMEKKVELWESPENMRRNILENLKRDYKEVEPKETQETEIALLAGGPSLELFADSGWTGPIITVNGAYNWAIERGFKPTAQIIVDPREFNKRFLQPVIPECRFLIGSQCHPSLAESVPKDQVLLWHSGDIAVPVIEEYSKDHGDRVCYPVFGGSTVMLRGLMVLSLLGLRKFHIYGWDSCLIDNEHHAYKQPENKETKIIEVIIGGKVFKCHTWMAMQAQEFIETVKHMLPDDCQLAVYGDGLIAHILRTGAIYGGSSLESL